MMSVQLLVAILCVVGVYAQFPRRNIKGNIFPESFAWAGTSPATGGAGAVDTFYVGSLFQGGIFYWDGKSKNATSFISDSRLTGRRALGVFATKTSIYWTSDNAAILGAKPGAIPAGNMASLVVGDISSKKVTAFIDLTNVNHPTNTSLARYHLANDVTVDSAGVMYVTDSFSGMVWKIPAGATDASGVTVLCSDKNLLPPPGQRAGANGLAITPDGKNLIVANIGGNALYRVALPGGGAATKISVTAGTGGFNLVKPDGLRFDSAGNLYVGSGSPRVLKLSSTDNWQTASVVGAAGYNHGSCNPTAVAPSPNGVYALCAFRADDLDILLPFPTKPFATGSGMTQVQTFEGPVVGVPQGSSVRAFYGIPYATAPVGELRWRPPQPNRPWTTPFNANQLPKACIQTVSTGPYGIPTSDQSEDCLRMNIYTPANGNPAFPYPVLIWIHGGSFRSGSLRNQDFNATDFLIARGNVIVVAIQYRLGPLGFMASEAMRYRSPGGTVGNYGLLDQRAAMQWVGMNIAAFGGDGSRITIWGESAGAGSIYDHVVMPNSFPFYNQVIMMSGSGDQWVAMDMHSAEWYFQATLNATGCDGVECLVSVDVAKIRALNKLKPRCAISNLAFTPTIDGVELTAHPNTLAAQGNFNAVPTILGFTNDEYLLFQQLPQNLNAQGFAAAVGGLTGIKGGPILNQVTNLYITKPSVPTTTCSACTPQYWGAARFLSHFAFTCPGWRSATRMSLAQKSMNSNVYAYIFAQPNAAGVSPHYSGVPYAFNKPRVTSLNGNAANLAQSMVNYWSNFATTGNPSDSGLPSQVQTQPAWTPFTAQWNMQVLVGGNIRPTTSAENMLWYQRCSLVNNVESLVIAQASKICPTVQNMPCQRQGLQKCLVRTMAAVFSNNPCSRATMIVSCFVANSCAAALPCSKLKQSCPAVNCSP